MAHEKEGTGGRQRATYPAVAFGGYDHHPRGDGTYDLSIKEGVPLVTYFTSNLQAPAWSIAVYSPRDDLDEEEIRSGSFSTDHLQLILGDMRYHSIPKDLVHSALGRADGDDVLRETARVFDETGAEDDIFEMLQTYLELVNPERKKIVKGDTMGEDTPSTAKDEQPFRDAGYPAGPVSMGGGRKLVYGTCAKSPDGKHHYTAISNIQSVEHFVCDHCQDDYWD